MRSSRLLRSTLHALAFAVESIPCPSPSPLEISSGANTSRAIAVETRQLPSGYYRGIMPCSVIYEGKSATLTEQPTLLEQRSPTSRPHETMVRYRSKSNPIPTLPESTRGCTFLVGPHLVSPRGKYHGFAKLKVR